MCNVLAYAGKIQRRIVSAWIGAAFAQDDATAARRQWRNVADQVRPRVPKLAGLLDEGEADVLVYMKSPAQHRAKLHSTDVMDKIFLAKYADLQFLLRLSRRCARKLLGTRAQVQTVRWRLFQTAGKIVCHGRQIWLKISAAMLASFIIVRDRCARILVEEASVSETS